MVTICWSVFDPLLPFSVLSGCAKSDTRVEGADAGSRKSTTRSDFGGLCSIPMRY
jgi:hypothetical protein